MGSRPLTQCLTFTPNLSDLPHAASHLAPQRAKAKQQAAAEPEEEEDMAELRARLDAVKA